MTQPPQEGFDRSVEEARQWMKAVQERLQVNDNTQGPRAALEARLRETEKICQLEPEGRVKVDVVLRAAEGLLACCRDGQKPEILAQLKDIKAQWEETVTYMTHCHSRIEWVWLHWSEYLLARDEFYRWFQKMMVVLELPVGLQLGLKEKQWQLSHARVLLHNVGNQAVLLDRLLEEAASLFNRIGDPSVDEDAQKRMKAEYAAVKAKAQDRVGLLEQVTREHEHFQAGVDEFQLWLKAVVEKVSSCLGRNCKLTTEGRLCALQDIAGDFPRGKESLRRLEEQAAGVIQNTSPLGAEKITEELEEMQKVLDKLRALWEEEEERLQGLLKSMGACEQQRRQLEAELGEFRKDLQRLAEEGLEPAAKAGTEDELVARWRLYSAALAESSRLKEQLMMLQLKRDLLRSVFGQDKATALLEQVASSVRDRDLLHNGLLQRKSKLQSLLAQRQDVGAAFEPLQKKLSDLQGRVRAENGLQQDLPRKQTQLSRLQGLQEEGLDLGAQMEAVRPLVQGNPTHQHKMEQLSADYQALQRSLEDLMDRCQQSVREHCTFSHQLLELRQWIAVVTQKLESHQEEAGPWDAQSREVEVERLLAEFPEKEAQLPLVEAYGRLVMKKSSPEGAALVQEELEELVQSWQALKLLEESLLSLIRNQQLQRTEVDSGKKTIFTNNIPKSGFLIDPTEPLSGRHRRANLLREEGSREGYSQLLRDFEQWLEVENAKLVSIIAMRMAAARDLRARETKLQELQARVPEGQRLFENLLHVGPARGSSDELEDLRYRWMLYKSKLKDSGHLLVLTPVSKGRAETESRNSHGRGADTEFSRGADWIPKGSAVARTRAPLPEGVLCGSPPAAAVPAVPAAAVPASGRGREPQLHAGQQLRPLLQVHAALRWPPAHLTRRATQVTLSSSPPSAPGLLPRGPRKLETEAGCDRHSCLGVNTALMPPKQNHFLYGVVLAYLS
ncbi:nesprin-3 isoform X5 [Lynx canadensis]|uniref:nesprin-3 isoform X5 n=1 Tax=Lynx canadensis TaxID=61383 RepID=UPI0011B0C04F|nr:nesprin-3 isoform X5 [Lynx canadensis]